MATQPEPKTHTITLSRVLAWIFGVTLVIAGLGGLLNRWVGFAIPLLLAGLILLPPVRALVRERWRIELSKWLIAGFVAVLLIVSVANTPKSEPSPDAVATGAPDAGVAASTTRCETGEVVHSTGECPRVLQLGERVQSRALAWTFTGSERRASVGSAYLTQEADGVYLVVTVEVENTANEASYVSADMIRLVDDLGREFAPDTGAGIYLDDGLTFDRINPGIVKKGVIVYDVPDDLKVARVRITDGLLGSNTLYVNLLG